MKIIIADHNEAFIEEAKKKIRPIAKVDIEFILGSPHLQAVDAVVSPANSFGFMDGGIDAAYTEYYGPSLQHTLQQYIKELPFQEILVGQALTFAVPGDRKPKWMISAPTMRIPQRIEDVYDIVLATRAAVRQARLNSFKSIAMPGMGTGAGGIPASIAAAAMKEGIETVYNPGSFPLSWTEARQRHIHTKK